jgi:hypothetical protein
MRAIDLLKLAIKFCRSAEYDCYWIRPDGSYFGGINHIELAREELKKHGIDTTFDAEMYRDMFDLGYIRAHIYNRGIAFQAQKDYYQSYLIDFILEKHLENKGIVEITDKNGYNRYTMQDFMEKVEYAA